MSGSLPRVDDVTGLAMVFFLLLLPFFCLFFGGRLRSYFDFTFFFGLLFFLLTLIYF